MSNFTKSTKPPEPYHPSRFSNPPLIMGVLNVTPDSFSDGGKFQDLDKALLRVEEMVAEGADIIDVGGESSRPGASEVSLTVELERVVPILRAIRARFPIRMSVDTTKLEVAQAAVTEGATLINDISGGADIRLPKFLVGHPAVDLILMHRQGTAATMQEKPHYPDGVVAETKRFLESRVRAFREFGISRSRIWVDPGIGFGKTVNHNLDLLRHLSQLETVASRVVVGTSRKNFLSRILSQENCPMPLRSAGTLATNLWALEHGASVFRVHDVGEMKRALLTWEAIRNGSF